MKGLNNGQSKTKTKIKSETQTKAQGQEEEVSDPEQHLNAIAVILDEMATDKHFNDVRVGIKVGAIRYALSELREELRETKEDIDK